MCKSHVNSHIFRTQFAHLSHVIRTSSGVITSSFPRQCPPRSSVSAARAAGLHARLSRSPDCGRFVPLSGVIEISPLRGERVVRNIRKCGAISRYKAALRFLLQQHSRFTFYFLPSTFYLLPFSTTPAFGHPLQFTSHFFVVLLPPRSSPKFITP